MRAFSSCSTASSRTCCSLPRFCTGSASSAICWVPKGIDDGVPGQIAPTVVIDVSLLAAVCRAAQRDGPAVVQGLVDAVRAAADRAQHVRRARQPDLAVAVLAMAADAGDCVAR